MEGRKGTCHFCFFDTEESAGTVFESIEFSEDWEDPKPPERGHEHLNEKGAEKQ
jgi:hypothetical protein